MALAKEKINIRIILSGASTVASCFMIAPADRDAAIKAIHLEFFD